MTQEQKSIAEAPNLTEALYEFFKYNSGDTKKIQEPYIKYFKGCNKILDIACGRGEFLELLSENGLSGVGIDLNQKLSEKLENKGLNCICNDVFTYLDKSNENSFDGIFSSHFVEHLESEQIVKLFELCSKVLKPNGVLIITTPNVGSLPMHLDYFHRDFSHNKFYHPKIIEFFLVYSGFSVIESGTNENFWFKSPIGALAPSSPLNSLSYDNSNLVVQSNHIRSNNPLVFIKNKISYLFINYILCKQFNKINEIVNGQSDKITKLNILIKKQSEIIEKNNQNITEINSCINNLYPPSEVYVIARKR